MPRSKLDKRNTMISLVLVFTILGLLLAFASCVSSSQTIGGKASAQPEAASPPPSASGTCGNGVAEGDEACDDGNLEDYDGCDTRCAIVRQRTCIINPVPEGHWGGASALHYSLGYESLCDLQHSNAGMAEDRNNDGRLDYNDECFYKDYVNACDDDGRTLYYYECSASSLPVKRSKECDQVCRDGECITFS